MDLKSLFGTLLLIFTFLGTYAQEEEVFSIVEEMPRFPGCELIAEAEIKECAQTKMYNFIRMNIRYPKDAYDSGITGRSIVQFIVNKDGSLSDFKTPRPNHPSLDAEAIRVIKSMPYWRAGKQRGAPARVKMTLPINFRLETAREKFASISDLFCEKYMAELISAEKLQALSKDAFENKDICGMNGMSATLVKISMTYTKDDKDTVIVSNNGTWTPAMNKILAKIKAGDSIAFDYTISYEIAEGKSFMQEEYRAIVAK